jgi:hypothetical protein
LVRRLLSASGEKGERHQEEQLLRIFHEPEDIAKRYVCQRAQERCFSEGVSRGKFGNTIQEIGISPRIEELLAVSNP